MKHPAVFVVIDDAAPTPPSAQIFEQIRAFIERGELEPGQALPPVRQLAADLGVAPNTVARAYDDLKNEGWVASESRRLTRVAPIGGKLARGSRRRALDEAIVAFLGSLRSRGYDASEIATELHKHLPALER